MPTYIYKREDGSTFEILQKISEEALKTCPETGQKVKRVITGGGGVVYKGSGWYVTDYKNKSNGDSGNASPAGKSNGSAKNGAENQKTPVADNTSGGSGSGKGSGSEKTSGSGKSSDDSGRTGS